MASVLKDFPRLQKLELHVSSFTYHTSFPFISRFYIRLNENFLFSSEHHVCYTLPKKLEMFCIYLFMYAETGTQLAAKQV